MMVGKYSAKAIEGMGADRTKGAIDLIEKSGGKVNNIYALLGRRDLLLIVELPDIEAAMKVSMKLSKLTGISFETLPAIEVEKFDEMVKDI